MRVAAIALLALGLAACGGTHSASGFRLPENGDIERGKTAFAELKCWACHTVDGMDFPAPTEQPAVPLGGRVREVRTDGYLVTSIIHPSHKLAARPVEEITVEGESRMPDYTMSITVRQLVDMVAMLQSRYRFEPPPPMTP